MNVFTAMILSSKRAAQAHVYYNKSGLVRLVTHQLTVREIVEGEYQFLISHIVESSPQEAHYVRHFTSDTLKAFLQEHFGIEEWQPLEDVIGYSLDKHNHNEVQL